MPQPGPGGQAGFVLFATILLVALTALAISAGSYIAARAVLVAGSHADAVRARLAAESAVRSATASWRAGAERGLPLLGERALAPPPSLAGGATGRVSVRRLGGDLYLLRGEGWAGSARARASMLVRVLSVSSVLPSFPAAIAAGQVRLAPSAAVGVLPPDGPPPPWLAGSCDSGAADTLAAVFGDVARPGVAVGGGGLERQGASIDGEPPVAQGLPDADSTGLGPLSWDRLAAAADRVETGALYLGPAERAGECDLTAQGNWGAPLDPASACAGYFALVYAPGDLRVLGGAGQGVLIVRGRLQLEGSSRFYGAILVAGDAEAEPGVVVWGALRAAAASWSGEARYSACALLRALGGAPGLGRPWRAGPRLWLPAF